MASFATSTPLTVLLFALTLGSGATACRGESSPGWGGGEGSDSGGGSDDASSGDDSSSGGDASSSSGGSGSSSGASGSSSGASGSSSSSSGGISGPGVPPFGGSSKGTGGNSPVNGDLVTTTNGAVQYRLIVPPSYVPGTPTPLLIVYSGTEGSQPMSVNLMSYAQQTGMDGFIRACLHGVVYYGNGQAGATVLDDLRAQYDIDNDRTYLMGESAGTTAAEQLGFYLRESYFAAYWANDVTAPDSPQQTAMQIGFAPWGQSGPGGQVAIATQIVGGMQTAGYRVPNPAPYDGPGYDTHGDLNQLQAAFSFFAGKTRQ
jgi:hypothetical protein